MEFPSREKLAYEIQYGGTEPPCPICGIPRCSRSDYIRCCRCGVNWDHGTDYFRDPRAQRAGLPRTDAKQSSDDHEG